MPPLTTVCSRFVAAIVALAVTVGPLRSVHAASGDSDGAGEARPVLFSLTVSASPVDRCGGELAVARAVSERLRREVFTTPDAADVTIAIATSPEPPDADPFPARIVATDRSGVELGRREVPVPAADCTKALETLAVVLAIMIGPPRTTTEPPRGSAPPDEPARVAPPPSPSSPRPSERPHHSSPAPPPRPLRWTASPLVGVAFGTGILPGIAWGIEGGAVVRPPLERLSFLARAAYWPGHDTRTRPPAEVDRASAALLGCYERRPAGLSLAGCVGLDVGRIQARSEGLTGASESSVIAGILGEARLGYRLPLGDRALVEPSLAAQLSAVVRRDRFIYRDPSGRELTLLLPAPVAVQTSFGVAVHFL